MLRKLRITLALLVFGCITLLFLDVTGTLHGWLGWLAKIQFLPAVMALNAGVIVLLVALTLLLGRVYCSVICPLGVMQDFMARLGRQFPKRRKLPYNYSPALTRLRGGVVVLFVAAQLLGWSAWAALIAPYSAYGRIANNLFRPLWEWGNNALAALAERMDSYAFYATEVWLKSLPVLIVAGVTFIVLFILAGRNGRTYCNTICPVGTILGFLSRFALFRVAFDQEKCVKCSLCARQCKASCIDYKNHSIDYSRCVACMNCLATCKHGALAYRLRPWLSRPAGEQAASGGETRRGFLTVAALFMYGLWGKACDQVAEGGHLTARETEVLRLLSRGRSVNVVARELSISANTAKTHAANIYRKAEVSGQQELIDVVESRRDGIKEGKEQPNRRP